jgi:hypothetical protein
MRNRHRRIAALERSRAVQHQQDEAIVVSALHQLSMKEIELLILASVADRASHALTESECAARQSYRLALRRECLWAGRRSTEGFEETPALRQVIVIAHARRLSDEDLKLVVSGLHAQQEGRAVSTDEAAALQTCQFEWERLCEMAGFSSTTCCKQGTNDETLSAL